MRLLAGLLALVALPALAQPLPACQPGPADPVPRDQARLNWQRPTTFVDGTAIPASTVLTTTIYRRVGTTDTAVCETTALVAGFINLPAGTHQWVATVRTPTSIESPRSNVAEKIVRDPQPSAPVLTVSSTLVGDAAYQCRDAAGNVISRNTRADKAQEACTNAALASVGTPYEVHSGGFLRIVAR